MDEEKGRETIALRSNGEVPVAEGQKTKQYIAAVAVCLGAMTAGTVLAWTSPALPILNNLNTTVLEQPPTKDEGMWIGSLIAIGALIGAIPTGIIAEKIGRKKTICGLAIPFIVSWIIIITATSVSALYAARVLAGISTGGVCVVAPMYIGEISEGSVRGALGSFFQLLLTIGILFVYVFGAAVSYANLGILCCVIPVLFLVSIFFLPETPLYLLKAGRRDEAERALLFFRGQDYDVTYEINSLKEVIEKEEQERGGIMDIFKSRANINALTVALGLMMFQQLSGINAVIFYTVDIFIAAGSTLDPSVCAIIVGVVQVIITCLATLLVDKAGRKILLLISATVMCICLVVLGLYFHLKLQDESSVANIGWIPLVSVNVFIVCFSLGFGPLPWMMMSELFASSIKGTASGLAVTLNWALTFVVTRTFADLQESLTPAGAFWLFGGTTGLAALFVFFKVPETKGKNFAEIQQMLGGK